LRRAKYFSEEYLNREFDIFLSLASNRYLDSLFSQQTDIRGGGRWFSHGNSGLFSYSSDIDEMQIDNLTYNPEEQLLVGVELKLGGRKNPDQILKYCLLFRRLLDRQFVSPDARFCLLFIGDQLVGGKEEQPDWADLIENEIAYCRKSPKSTGRKLVDVNVLDISKKCTFCCTTWQKVWDLNEAYAHGLDLPAQEVERKLIEGFNETLATKTFLDFRRG
jgi:hypothetical protein